MIADIVTDIMDDTISNYFQDRSSVANQKNSNYDQRVDRSEVH